VVIIFMNDMGYGEFGPAGVDVGERQTPHEFPAAAASAVRDGVDFQPAGTIHLPRPATHGDGALETVAGAAGASSMAACIAEFVRGGNPVELAGAALQDLAAGFFGQAAVVRFVALKPQRDGRLE
jgi:hypothetical protein